MNDGTGLAEALLGLEGFRVLEVLETSDELVIKIETTVEWTGCVECGVRAEAQDRMAVAIRDLACFGRPARLLWRKRRWRCLDPDCEAKTWTETSEQFSPRVLLIRRAGPKPAVRWVRTPGPWPSRPRSWVCAGGRRWARSSSTARPWWPTRPGRTGRPARHRRDLMAGRQPGSPHPVCDGPGRPRRPHPHRHGGGKRRR
jgi:hypothetical protein